MFPRFTSSHAILARGGVFLLGLLSCSVHAQPSPHFVWSKVTHNIYLSPTAVSPNNTLVASGGPGTNVRLSSLVDGGFVRDLIGHTGVVESVAFSPDGATLASCGEDRTVRLWDVTSGALLRTIPQGGGNRQFVAVAFHPGGEYVASDRNRTNLALWKVSDGTLAWETLGNRKEIHSVTFSPDGMLVASAGGYRALDTSIRIVRTVDGQLLTTLVTSNGYNVERLAFSPDGKWLAAGTDESAGFGGGSVEVWRVADWTRSLRLPVRAPLVAFSPDSQLVITLRRRYLEFWRMPQGSLVRSLMVATNEADFSPHESLAISTSGDRIVTGQYRFIAATTGTIAEGVTSAIEFPVVLSIARDDAAQVTLRWTGGYSFYQLQRRPAQTPGWENVGSPTINHSITLPIEQSNWLFRVLAY
jgi:WD40 repeat protein